MKVRWLFYSVSNNLLGWVSLREGYLWHTNLSTFFLKRKWKVYLKKRKTHFTDQLTLFDTPKESDREIKKHLSFPLLETYEKKSIQIQILFSLEVAVIGKVCESMELSLLCSSNQSNELSDKKFILGNLKTSLQGKEKKIGIFATWKQWTYKIYEKTDEVCITLDSGGAQSRCRCYIINCAPNWG